MSWDRAPVAAALVDVLTAATAGAVTVFGEPPQTLNPPAVVVGPATMPFSAAALAVDEADLAVMVVAPVGRLNDLDALAQTVRNAVVADPTLSGAVKTAYPYEQRNNRNVTVAGIDLSVVEVAVRVVM